MLGRNINLEEVDEKVLYHYTKSNGINGIMNNKCFWATKKDFLNDPNEISYVNKILREVCSDYIPDQKKLEMFLSDINDNGSGAEYFVLSFSCCRDSITMWAEFGNANGYNIGFDSNKIVKRISEANPVEYHGMVIYDSGRQKQEIVEFMEEMLKEYPDLYKIIELGCEERNNPAYMEVCEAFRKKLAVYAMFFKDEAFSQEQEYRFVFGKKADTRVLFRVKDGYIIPYIEIPLSTERLPVNEIVVAPKNHIDLAKKGMEYMMKTLDYNVPVTLSDIKLRY